MDLTVLRIAGPRVLTLIATFGVPRAPTVGLGHDAGLATALGYGYYRWLLDLGKDPRCTHQLNSDRQMFRGQRFRLIRVHWGCST